VTTPAVKPAAARSRAFRERKAAAQQAQIRGIFAPPPLHPKIKAAAAKIINPKERPDDQETEQAVNNTKEQFAASPDLANEIMNAVMDALTAHTAMSKQALESEKLRADMKDVLLGAERRWEGLRERAGA
jgi:hypothetical protein